MYYDVNKTLSHNCLLNFIVGQRGVGKTYALKRKGINDFLRKGKQFIYLRRYETEIKKGQMDKFFDDICLDYPDHIFGVRDGAFFIDGHIAGYYLCLSKSAQYKSVPFPDVELIIFDEFIIDVGMIRYLPNEVIAFNEFYSTVARLRDVRVFFLSNAITFTNPYFLYYDLKLQQGQTLVKKNDILLELVKNDEYQEVANQTRFGRIIKGTEYGQYAYENNFLRDDDSFIEKMSEPGIALFSIKIENYIFTVYRIIGNDNWYVSERNDPSVKKTISVNIKDHNEETTYSNENGTTIWWHELKQKYFRAELRFTTLKAKNLLTNILKKGK